MPARMCSATGSGKIIRARNSRACKELDIIKTVLITGGSRGIGRAAVERFFREGWAVAFGWLHAEEEMRRLCARLPGITAIRADLADPAGCESLVRSAEQALGHLDGLVLNAGTALPQGLLTDLSLEDWDRLFAVNVRSAFLCCRAALPGMIRRHQGSIVTLSSMWGQTGGSCEAAYSASKAAVIGLTRALAKEVGPSGVRVNCVAPGVISTDMNRSLSEADFAALREETPLGVIGSPEETADAIWYFTACASFVTGQVLGVNGGMVI